MADVVYPLYYTAVEHLAFSLTVGVFVPPQSPKDTQTSTCSVKALYNLVCVSVWLLTGAVLLACSGEFSSESHRCSLQDWTHLPQLHQPGDKLQVSYTQLSVYSTVSLSGTFAQEPEAEHVRTYCTCRGGGCTRANSLVLDSKYILKQPEHNFDPASSFTFRCLVCVRLHFNLLNLK